MSTYRTGIVRLVHAGLIKTSPIQAISKKRQRFSPGACAQEVPNRHRTGSCSHCDECTSPERSGVSRRCTPDPAGWQTVTAAGTGRGAGTDAGKTDEQDQSLRGNLFCRDTMAAGLMPLFRRMAGASGRAPLPGCRHTRYSRRISRTV